MNATKINALKSVLLMSFANASRKNSIKMCARLSSSLSGSFGLIPPEQKTLKNHFLSAFEMDGKQK